MKRRQTWDAAGKGGAPASHEDLFFVTDGVKGAACAHPDLETQKPFASLLEGAFKGVAASGKQGLAGSPASR